MPMVHRVKLDCDASTNWEPKVTHTVSWVPDEEWAARKDTVNGKEVECRYETTKVAEEPVHNNGRGVVRPADQAEIYTAWPDYKILRDQFINGCMPTYDGLLDWDVNEST